jgi:hypothetical protein
MFPAWLLVASQVAAGDGGVAAPQTLWVDVQSVYVRAGPDARTARVGLLAHGDVVEVRGCVPDCAAKGAWALLTPYGAVPRRVLREPPRNALAQAHAADAVLVHGTARWDAPVFIQPDEHAQAVGRLRGGWSYAWRDNTALLERGFLERLPGGFVRAQDVRLATPSTRGGALNPPQGVLALLMREMRLEDAGVLLSRDTPWVVDVLEPRRVRVGEHWLPREHVRLATARPRPAGLSSEARWVHVDLRQQVLTAYEGNTLVYVTLVSTGTADHPTPTGRFTLLQKVQHSTMEGEHQDYLVEEVPHVMPIHGDVALHGAFWHDAFGTPVSHGCINLPPIAAAWLFDWAQPALPHGWHAVMPQPGAPVLTVVVERAPTPVPATAAAP